MPLPTARASEGNGLPEFGKLLGKKYFIFCLKKKNPKTMERQVLFSTKYKVWGGEVFSVLRSHRSISKHKINGYLTYAWKH